MCIIYLCNVKVHFIGIQLNRKRCRLTRDNSRNRLNPDKGRAGSGMS